MSSIKDLVKGRENIYKVIVAPDNIIPFLQGGDFSICAGGRTMYELLYLKKPFLPIAGIRHEAEAVSAFVREGLISFGFEEWNAARFLEFMKRVVPITENNT